MNVNQSVRRGSNSLSHRYQPCALTSYAIFLSCLFISLSAIFSSRAFLSTPVHQPHLQRWFISLVRLPSQKTFPSLSFLLVLLITFIFSTPTGSRTLFPRLKAECINATMLWRRVDGFLWSRWVSNPQQIGCKPILRASCLSTPFYCIKKPSPFHWGRASG